MDQQQDNTKIINKILSGTRWAATFRLVAQGFSWIITIIVIRFISPGDYGLNAMLEAPLELLMLLSTLGLDAALVRSKDIKHQELQSTFGWLLIINGMLFLGYFFGGTFITAYFKEPRLDQLAKVIAFIFLLVPFRVIPNALLARDLKFKLIAFVELTSNVAAAITTLTLAIMGAGVWALVIGVLVKRTLSAILLMILQPWFIKPSFDYTVLRDMAAFGGVMTFWEALNLVSYKVISFVAGPILGKESLGIFTVALQFAMLPLAKVMPILNPILFPAFSKFQEQRGVATYYLLRSLGIVSLGLFPIMVGTACIAQEITSTILGEKWIAAAIPLSLLSLAMLFRMMTVILRPVMSSIGRPGLAVKSTSLMFIVLLPLILIGVKYGVMGLVVPVLITETIVMIGTIKISKSILDSTFITIAQSLRPAIVSSAIMATCVLGVKAAFSSQFDYWSLFLEIGVGVISYYLSLRLLYHKQLIDAIKTFLGRR